MTNHMFRAWDRKLNRMLYIGSFVSLADFFNTKIEQGIESLELFKVDYKWMQCIGLRNCNGRDIFEGDIVKDDTNIAVVRFGEYQANNNHSYSNEAAYGFYLEYISHKGVIDHATNVKYYEVIGNIFENPELIAS